MNNTFVWKYVGQFVLLMLLQVLLLDKIALWGFLTPMLYILCILTLPFQTPRWLVVLLGFGVGLFEDCFTGIMGVHAAATTCIAFARPLIINLIPFNSTIEDHMRPILWDMHFGWFTAYSFIMCFIHQLLLFFFDAFSLAHCLHWIGASLLNSLFTVMLILVVQSLFYNSSKRY